MTSNGFTLADPDDPGMLDMAEFDSAAPEVIMIVHLSIELPIIRNRKFLRVTSPW